MNGLGQKFKVLWRSTPLFQDLKGSRAWLAYTVINNGMIGRSTESWANQNTKIIGDGTRKGQSSAGVYVRRPCMNLKHKEGG